VPPVLGKLQRSTTTIPLHSTQIDIAARCKELRCDNRIPETGREMEWSVPELILMIDVLKIDV
jgi:hypothetical protein